MEVNKEQLDRVKYLFEYKVKTIDNVADDKFRFPTFDEYKTSIIEEDDEENADDAEDTPTPTDEPQDVPDELEPENLEGSNDEFEDMGGDNTDSSDAVKSTFSGEQQPSDMDANIEMPDPNTEIFNKLETQITDQDSKIDQIIQNLEKINSFLPKPETAEDKIIKKLDAIENDIMQIKQKEEDKSNWKFDNTPFNIKLTDYYNDNDEESFKGAKEEFKITDADVNDYDENKIKRSLGLK